MKTRAYGPDLSAIHHDAFGSVAREAGPSVVRWLTSAGIRRGLVVDLGCGSGILAAYLLSHGYDVLGIDASVAMLRIARGIAPRAKFVEGRAEVASLPRCAAVIATGESITYLGDRAKPGPLLALHIQRVARALTPGGLFVFDAVVAREGKAMSYIVWRSSVDWDVVADVREDPQRRAVTRRIVTFTRRGQQYRRSEERHRVGVYERQDVLGLLRAHGFRAHTRPSYGDTPMPRRAVFVARLSH